MASEIKFRDIPARAQKPIRWVNKPIKWEDRSIRWVNKEAAVSEQSDAQ